MTLADVLVQISRFDDALSIYAAPRWSTSSQARVLAEPHDGSHPLGADGMTYLATVAGAKRAIAAERRDRAHASAAQIVAAVLYYAIYDELEPHSCDELYAQPVLVDLALAM
jgi:hypothetical protein